jgi:hypothetical protein
VTIEASFASYERHLFQPVGIRNKVFTYNISPLLFDHVRIAWTRTRDSSVPCILPLKALARASTVPAPRQRKKITSDQHEILRLPILNTYYPPLLNDTNTTERYPTRRTNKGTLYIRIERRTLTKRSRTRTR